MSNDYTTEKVPLIRWDHNNLYPDLPGKRLNPSIIEWEGAYAFCWRDGWAGSNVWICRLDKSFQPVGDAVRLGIKHPSANYAREDPRLFIHQGKLHVSVIGVTGHAGRILQTVQLYVRLGSAFLAEDVFSPTLPGIDPTRWQKNHLFVSHEEKLYDIYSLNPVRVLDLEKSEWLETPKPVMWHGGEMRGGATPVRVGDELWCFFHDSWGFPMKSYRIGLVTLDANPPFRPRRIVPKPLLVPQWEAKPKDHHCAVVWASGAVRVGPQWVIAVGANDRWSELHEFTHAELEARLEAVREWTG